MFEAEVKVTIEVSILVTGHGETTDQVIRSAENSAQAMDLDDISLVEHWRIHGYGVDRTRSELYSELRKED